MKLRRLETWLLALCIALCLPLAAISADDDDDGGFDEDRTISVNGTGTVRVKPNLVRTSIGLNITSPTFGEAMRRHRESMGGILEQLGTLGVEEKDILTDNFSFHYRPPWKRDGEWNDGQYQVNNTVRVFIRDLEKVDLILESMVESGANQIHGLEFLVEDTSGAESQARKKAAENAHAKAQELALLHDVKLGRVIRVSEGATGGPGPMRMERALKATAESSSTVSPGERSVSARLSVVYAIK
jgi:uncharacterized protein YggE